MREDQKTSMSTKQITFYLSVYNGFFLFAFYKVFESKYEAEVLRYKNAELIKMSLVKELEGPAPLLTEITVLKVVGVFLVLGVAAYGFHCISSMVSANCAVKAYTMGNAYLLGVLDRWAGVPSVPEVGSSVPQEILPTESLQEAISAAGVEELQGLSELMTHLGF